MNTREFVLKLRSSLNLSQAAFAEQLGTTQQAVQKWESGATTPTLENIILIAKKYGVSLDASLLDTESKRNENKTEKNLTEVDYFSKDTFEIYSELLEVELKQSGEEGLNLDGYKSLFCETVKLPRGKHKKEIADILFQVVQEASKKDDYGYLEPSEYEEIKKLTPYYPIKASLPTKSVLKKKIEGAWFGRVCGCMLGKTIEGVRTKDLIPFLKITGNYPMKRYITRADLNNEQLKKEIDYCFPVRVAIDDFNFMPADDDTNYTVMYQDIIERFGRNFTPRNVIDTWIEKQNKNAYFTAERIAFINAINGYYPPYSAIYQNPFREWIGAQIRGDYFGYINPGKPMIAAEMAFRDASVSHTKNGIYGEMFVAAMLAVAAVSNNIKDIIRGGLAQIPRTSRLTSAIEKILDGYEKGVTKETCFENIHKEWDENDIHGWCHTIPNAMIVVASLLYGKEDYEKSICMAVETGFDTDCNGATVGSILGMKNGIGSIPSKWTDPINDTVETTLFGVGKVKISDRVDMTMRHIAL